MDGTPFYESCQSKFMTYWDGYWGVNWGGYQGNYTVYKNDKEKLRHSIA